MKKGIELEYFTINNKGELCSAEKITDELEFTAPEFATCVAEIKTEPYESLEKLKQDLVKKTLKTIEVGKKHDIKLVPLGSPLNHGSIELLESERLDMMKKFNEEDIEVEKDLARVGLHIHFEKRNVKTQLNILTALDPAFAALNSSPYHKGEQQASSCRNWVYRYGWQPKFPESVSLWPYTDSVQEWKDRIHDAFEDFKQGAVKAGVSEKKFMKHHHPDRSIWTPIRLRDQFPTVEYRSPDTTIVSEALKLVEDIENILEKSRSRRVEVGSNPGVEEDKITLPVFEQVEKLSKKAAKKGLRSEKVRSYLESMDINPNRYEPVGEKVNKEENITLEEAKELRLRASDILEEDVRSMQ